MESKKFQIAVVEDNPYYNKVLSSYLRSLCKTENFPALEFEIKSFHSAKECLEQMDHNIKIMILDYYLDEKDKEKHANGLAVMNLVNKSFKDCKVIVVSGQNNMAITAELFKMGIYDYLEKDNNSAIRIWGIVQKIIKDDLKKPGLWKRLFNSNSVVNPA